MGRIVRFPCASRKPRPTSAQERPVTEAEIARALLSARDGRNTTTPPTRRGAGFGLDEAYRVGAALDRRLRERGYRRAGCKVGFTNKAIWSRFGMEEPIVAPVYDRTIHAAAPTARVSLAAFCAPRIEVEVVFGVDPDGGIAGAEGPARPAWVALGFEIVDCHYPDWHLTPADSVADFGLHGALVIGPRIERTAPGFEECVARLDRLEVRLLRDERPPVRGRGSDVLGHPLAALDFVPRLLPRFDGAGMPASGGVVSTGTMTALEPLAAGERWRVEADGVDLPGLELVLTD